MSSQTPSFETMRHAMVASQLRTNAVNDARVVAAMAQVPREEFVTGEARGVRLSRRAGAAWARAVR